jgi:hypothetical protein
VMPLTAGTIAVPNHKTPLFMSGYRGLRAFMTMLFHR